MYLNDETTSVTTPPAIPAATGITPGYFTGGNPATGQAASVVRFWHLNMLFQELMAFLTAAGIAPDKANNGQVLASCQKLFSPGRYLGTQSLTASGTFAAPAGATTLRIRMVGAGGAGGAAPVCNSGYYSVGSGGAAGAELDLEIPVSAFSDPSAIPFAIGAAAVGGAAAGSAGGDTSIGNSTSGPYAVAGGGNGGPLGISVKSGTAIQVGQALGGVPDTSGWTGTVLSARQGEQGRNGLILGGSSGSALMSGTGASSSFGVGGNNTNDGPGSEATGYGAGGSGAATSGAAQNGGASSPGKILVEAWA